MLPPIPDPAAYDISPSHGFLPSTLPLARLPDPYYNKWEAIVANLQGLILSRRLRSVVDKLPVLTTIGLEHDAEWRRAYSLLCFMAHAYVWNGDTPAEKLPTGISVPLLEISERLEVLPVATYAAVCLWNFKPLFVDEEVDHLENLATLTTFTGSLDESWFYLVSVAIEARGGPIIPLMLDAIAAARRNDVPTVIASLEGFAERLTDLTNILQRMHESCDPTVFYNRIRPFLAGSKNMTEAGLPRGVLYEDSTGREEYRQYSGGSNAQSSLIQFFDIVLGVEHRPTGEKADPGSETEREYNRSARHNFIQDMRRYMPGPHRRFLRDVDLVANIKDFVLSHPESRLLRIAYDACLTMLSAFRDKHIAIVTRYIITPSRESRARSVSPAATRDSKKQNIATSSRKEQDGEKKRGTGGTALIPFLKQARDETGEPAVEEWVRRFIKRKVKTEEVGDFFKGKERDGEETVEVKGLAWSWTMDDDVGGICQY